jgi:hypothetical protein
MTADALTVETPGTDLTPYEFYEGLVLHVCKQTGYTHHHDRRGSEQLISIANLVRKENRSSVKRSTQCPCAV